MITALLVIDILVCLALVGLILIQHGKGADVGAAFGSGASQTVFGSQGSASFLTRSTAVLAVLFFVISLALAYLYGQRPDSGSVIDRTPAHQGVPQPLQIPAAPAQNSAPATPQPPADVPAAPPQ
ncbi:MAG: preprotein translocase subunit SecG [Pseudomonadota bacterium]